jgi:hypothetical protein
VSALLRGRKVRCWTMAQARAYFNACLIDELVFLRCEPGWVLAFFTPGEAPALVTLCAGDDPASGAVFFPTLSDALMAGRHVGPKPSHVAFYPNLDGRSNWPTPVGRPATASPGAPGNGSSGQ